MREAADVLLGKQYALAVRGKKFVCCSCKLFGRDASVILSDESFGEIDFGFAKPPSVPQLAVSKVPGGIGEQLYGCRMYHCMAATPLRFLIVIHGAKVKRPFFSLSENRFIDRKSVV